MKKTKVYWLERHEPATEAFWYLLFNTPLVEKLLAKRKAKKVKP